MVKQLERPEAAGRGQRAAPLVLVSANSSWNIVNFRLGVLRALTGAGYRVAVAAPPDEHSAGLRELGFEFHPVPMSRSGMNPFADALLFARFRQVMGKVRPAVYLGYTIKPNVYGSLAAAGSGAAVINTVTGLGTAFLERPWLERLALQLYRFAFRRSFRVFFQNADDRRLFLDKRVVSDRQARLVGGSGIDLARFAPRGGDAASPTFLFIGRLLADKGVREFVAAARMLKAGLPNARFQLLGDLDPANRSSISADELRNWTKQGVVEHLGSADDVRPFIARTTAVVLPSYREGMPRTLLEGAAMGRPLVATDVPGSREIVEEGVTGALARVKDAESLARAMGRIAALGGVERARLGMAARLRVEERFSETAVAAAYLEALDEALASVRT